VLVQPEKRSNKKTDRLELDLLLDPWSLSVERLKRVDKKVEERKRADATAAIVAILPGASAKLPPKEPTAEKTQPCHTQQHN